MNILQQQILFYIGIHQKKVTNSAIIANQIGPNTESSSKFT